jgi:hypothetical protein
MQCIEEVIAKRNDKQDLRRSKGNNEMRRVKKNSGAKND